MDIDIPSTVEEEPLSIIKSERTEKIHVDAASLPSTANSTCTPIYTDYEILRLTPAKTSPSLSTQSPPNAHDGQARVTPSMVDISIAAPNSSVSGIGTMITEEDVGASEDFYGTSSTASFLKQAFDSMKDGSDCSCKRVNGSPHEPLCKHSRREAGRDWRRDSTYFVPSHQFALPPRELADHLIETFRDKVYYMYPFFHFPSFENAYRSLWQPSSEPRTQPYSGLGLGCYPEADANTISFHAALNIVFSLACNYSDLPAAERLAASNTFFLRIHQFVGLDLLESNNLSVVQTLLLLALVLQGSQHPSRCWNASGIACRVAQGLGLHAEHHQDTRGSLEKEVRRRTWYGCVVMDM